MLFKILRVMILSIASGMIALTIAGCSTLQERSASQSIRHPCGNIWNICRGDSAILDTISRGLTGG